MACAVSRPFRIREPFSLLLLRKQLLRPDRIGRSQNIIPRKSVADVAGFEIEGNDEFVEGNESWRELPGCENSC